jgi:hypothetical protein
MAVMAAHERAVDLTDPDVRRELAGPLAAAMVSLADTWGLTGAQSAALVGVVGSWAAWTGGDHDDLGVSQSRRIADLLELYSALASVHGRRSADAWALTPNEHPLLAGRTPAAAVAQDGDRLVEELLEAMRSVQF